MANKTYTIKQNGVNVFSITITIPDSEIAYYDKYQWDSKTGQVTAYDSRLERRVLVPHVDNTVAKNGTVGTLKPKDFETTNILSMEYDYLYY